MRFPTIFLFFSAVNKKPTPTQPPSFSRKIKVLSFILGVCCIIAIIINFINLQSDYEEVHEFYIGFMGRKMLIQERRLTSRSYLNMLRREHLLDVEVFLILNVSQSFVMFLNWLQDLIEKTYRNRMNLEPSFIYTQIKNLSGSLFRPAQK